MLAEQDNSRVSVVYGLRATWAALVAVLFFTNLDGYVYLTTGLWFFRPVYWTLAALFFSLPFLPKQSASEVLAFLRSPVGIWFLVFIALSVLYWLLFPRSQAATAALFQHIHFSILSGLFILVFSLAPRVVMIAIAVATVSVALFNWFEFFYPIASNTFDCRAAGTFINPNVAAMALVLGMLAGILVIPDRARPWFAIFIGIAILPTYSRSGALIYMVAILALLAGGTVNWRHLALPVLAGTVASVLLFSLALMDVAGRKACVLNQIGDRVKAFKLLTPLAGERLRESTQIAPKEVVSVDVSTQSRVILLQRAIQEYRADWIVGRGLGVAWGWEDGQRSHNMYLEKGMEMGLAGLLLWPALLILLPYSVRGRPRTVAWALAASGLVLGFFSHNLFESRQMAVILALLILVSADKKLA